ncbi:MAG TPA: hypothetical protein VGC76_04995 [Pyrinomonadaceae bacterium]
MSLRAQTYEVVIYTPTTGFNETNGYGLGGVQRVGAARIADAVYPEHTHALLWLGKRQSRTKTNYSRYRGSHPKPELIEFRRGRLITSAQAHFRAR